MDLIAGMQPTGRRVQGPGFELAGLDGDRGAHTAVVWTLSQRTGAELAVRDGVRAFLERPGFAGLARLVAVDRTAGAVVFATGEVWSAAEVLASLRRRGRAPGLRAGLELAWQAAELLARAHREAGPLGAPCHGAIDPWRLALRRDGQVVLLGYDILGGRHGLGTEGAALAEALRYAPPERLEGRDEDATSDLFSLALVALEWIVGEPVYAGTVDQIREAAREAEGDRVLWAWRERLPKSVAAVLGRALRRDVDARWPDAASFAAALRQELGAPDLDGPSLHALLSSKDIDPPNRFVALEEERGDADARVGDPMAEATPEAPAQVRARIVSLGGRLGRAARAGAASGPPVVAPPVVEPPSPPPAPPVVAPPAPPEATVVSSPEATLVDPNATYAEPEEEDDAGEAALAELMDAPLPGAKPALTDAPPAPPVEAEVPEDAPTIEQPRHVVEDARAGDASAAEGPPTAEAPTPEDTLAVEPPTDDAPTLEDMPARNDAPVVEPPADDAPAVEQRRPGAAAATVWEPVGPVTLLATTPDGPEAQATVEPELSASRAALALVAAAGLSRLDTNGRVVAIWRLARDGAAMADTTRAAALADSALSLTRADARSVAVRVRVASRVVEANVSTALFAVEAAAALAGVGGLATGRALRIDGADVPPDALLDGLIRPGVTVEIVP